MGLGQLVMVLKNFDSASVYGIKRAALDGLFKGMRSESVSIQAVSINSHMHRHMIPGARGQIWSGVESWGVWRPNPNQ